MYKLRNKRNHGITLIALVITIIVLLILAGISITMLTGDNAILKQATNARSKNIHGNVYEKLQIEGLAYLTDKTTSNIKSTLIEYLSSKEILGEKINDENNEEIGKWQINVEKLLGTKQSIGNGSNYKDVYMLEEKEEDGKKNYEINYYEKDESTKVNVGILNGLNTIVAEDPFTLRYEYGYLWADFKDGALKSLDTLSEEEKQNILDNYLMYMREEFEKSGHSEEEINSMINQTQSILSSANDERKKQIISSLINNSFSIEPKGTEEYSWSSKYNRMLIREKGEYKATYYDFSTSPYKKYERSINIENLDEYIIDLGTDSRSNSYYISFKHFEDNEYKTVYADRVILKLDGVEMFNGVPPEHDESSFVYWYFENMNANIENNKEYMADITAYFGDKEVKFKGKITIDFQF